MTRAAFAVAVVLALAAPAAASWWPRAASAPAPEAPAEQPHKCIHDREQEKITVHHAEVPHAPELRRDAHWTADFDPIRIHVDTSSLDGDAQTCYTGTSTVKVGNVNSVTPCSDSVTDDCVFTCTTEDIVTASKKAFLRTRLIPAATQFFERALGVRNPPAGNITTALTICGSSLGFNLPIPEEVRTDGIDTDLIILTSARPTTGSTIAFASLCVDDALDDRPLIGYINFGAAKINSDPLEWDKQLGVAVHELTHVLGFSSSRYGLYRDPTGASHAAVTDTVSRTSGGETKTLSFIVTPNVVAAAREHFSCPSLEGGELEDGGGAGTGGSHWEKIRYNNEYMTGSASDHPVFSNLTFALFADTGWYLVNWNYAQQLVWGWHKGCYFAEQRCNNDLWGSASGDNLPYQCGYSDPDYQPCTFDRYGKGFCNVRTFTSALDPWYQHYTDGTQGGTSSLGDHCGFWVPFSSDHECHIPGNAELDPLYAVIGQQYSATARCFLSTLKTKRVDEDAASVRRPGCHEMYCPDASTLMVHVGDSWVTCPAAGGEVAVHGFEGVLFCPSASEACRAIRGSVEFGGAVDAAFGFTESVIAVSAVDPATSSILGGLDVTVTGTGFRAPENCTLDASGNTTCVPLESWTLSSVHVGETPCTDVADVTPTSLRCSLGVFLGAYADETQVDVTVRTSDGRVGVGTRMFTWTAKKVRINGAPAAAPSALMLTAVVLAGMMW